MIAAVEIIKVTIEGQRVLSVEGVSVNKIHVGGKSHVLRKHKKWWKWFERVMIIFPRNGCNGITKYATFVIVASLFSIMRSQDTTHYYNCHITRRDINSKHLGSTFAQLAL